MTAAMIAVFLVIAALLLPARIDPAIWLKERTERPAEVDE